MQKIMQLFIVLLLILPVKNVSAKPRIAWIAPMTADASGAADYSSANEFWSLTSKFMIASVEDLDIELKIYCYGRNRFKMVDAVKQIASGKDGKFDAVLFYNFHNVGVKTIKILDQVKIPAFTFVTNFSQHPEMGKPREKYKYWIGQMIPDDQHAGELLATKLIEAYQNQKGHLPTQIVALGGEYAHTSDIDRRNGLENALKNYPQLKLNQYIHAFWKRQTANNQYPIIRQRYPETKIFWAANDAMALGIYERINQEKLMPGKDIIFGGIDWLGEAIDLIRQGKMNVSVGGHFLQGAFSLVLLHDYALGKDFAEENGVTFEMKMYYLTRTNIKEFENLASKMTLENIREKIDFRKYSRVHNPEVKKYPFSIKELLKQL